MSRFAQPFLFRICMLCAYTRPRSQVMVFQYHWSSGLYVHDFWPRTRNDIDLQYSHSFINSIRCLLLPTIRSLAAIVSEKSTVFTFSYRKAQIKKFDLAVK